MHFVGNRAIVLQNGDPQRQILYNPGFTALSFFMPIVVLIFAFYTLGMPSRARLLRLAIAGFLTGAAVCGMHYLGQLGVENYHCSYRVQNVVGAAIIAVLASFIALSVFFRLRETWTDSWWKRLLCGCVLALAVSGMHWSAAVGTIYVWKGDLSIHGNTRTQTAIIAASLVCAPLSTKSSVLTGTTVHRFLCHPPRGDVYPRSESSQRQKEVTASSPRLCLFRRGWQIDGHPGRNSAEREDNKSLCGEGRAS